MRRRNFFGYLGTATFWPLIARAQQSQLPVIGFLATGSAEPYRALVAAFREGLREAGYVEGENVSIAYRWAEGHYDRLAALTTDLVERKVTVIAAIGGNAPELAAKAATKTIPIVFASGGDPVRAGLVASLNRPGGNVTGIASLFSALVPKRLEVLFELAPKAKTIGVLVNPDYPDSDVQLRELQEAERSAKQRLQIGRATTSDEIDSALAALAQRPVDALLIANDPFLLSRRNQIVAFAARRALPAIYFDREFTSAGGLISYGPNLATVMRQAGVYTGRVLKGAKPVDLPVMQPTNFELVINLKTAKALGLTVPQSLLVRADEVIE